MRFEGGGTWGREGYMEGSREDRDLERGEIHEACNQCYAILYFDFT